MSLQKCPVSVLQCVLVMVGEPWALSMPVCKQWHKLTLTVWIRIVNQLCSNQGKFSAFTAQAFRRVYGFGPDIAHATTQKLVTSMGLFAANGEVTEVSPFALTYLPTRVICWIFRNGHLLPDPCTSLSKSTHVECSLLCHAATSNLPTHMIRALEECGIERGDLETLDVFLYVRQLFCAYSRPPDKVGQGWHVETGSNGQIVRDKQDNDSDSCSGDSESGDNDDSVDETDTDSSSSSDLDEEKVATAAPTPCVPFKAHTCPLFLIEFHCPRLHGKTHLLGSLTFGIDGKVSGNLESRQWLMLSWFKSERRSSPNYALVAEKLTRSAAQFCTLDLKNNANV